MAESMGRGRGRGNFVFYWDALLFAMFVVLLSPRLTGLTVHEWLGIAFAVPILVHLLLAWPWIATATRRMLSPKRPRDAVNTLLNLALFVTTMVVVISGVVISQVSLPGLGIVTINDRAWRHMHNSWTNWMWFAVSAHIAMNWRWIATALRNAFTRRAQ